MKLNTRLQRLATAAVGMAIALLWASVSLLDHSPAQAAEQTATSMNEVCAIVTTMPDAADTDTFLSLLDTDRATTISDLTTMKTNMERYNAEGYGWQNVIDSPDSSEPQPGAWLLGAVRMACEAKSTAATVSGTVTYLQRIALPTNATVVVTLEDVSLADVPSTVIAGKPIRTAGQQVPIPFSLAYDPAEIVPQNRYVVRAQIFYDDALQWTSTTAYPVITQGNPTEVEIQVQQV